MPPLRRVLLFFRPWLHRRVQTVVTTEQVMTDRNYVVKRAGRRKEHDNKREREGDPAMMLLQPDIKCCHHYTPRRPTQAALATP